MRAVVRGSIDTAESQTADVTIAAGIERSKVEIVQPFGIASRAPKGGLAIVLAVGGDTGDLVALPVAMPGRRLGNLPEGETAIYSIDGTRVHVTADGWIKALATQGARIKVGSAEIVVTADSITATIGDAQLEMTADKIRASVGSNKATVSATAARLVAGDQYFAVTPLAIIASVAVTIGPDPDPGA